MSASRAKLPTEHIRFGYAGFLREDDFNKADPSPTSPNHHD
jgi:hypothetical protein